jgi:putative transposase
MSYVKIMVHAVWRTKFNQPVLEKSTREILFAHIRDNARKKEIYIDTLGGYIDHVHCLVSLGSEQNISKVIQLLKGESSYWANKEKLINPKLEWAEDYYASSISETSYSAGTGLY